MRSTIWVSLYSYLECPDNTKKNQKVYKDESEWLNDANNSKMDDFDNEDLSKLTIPGRGNRNAPAKSNFDKFDKSNNSWVSEDDASFQKRED